MVEHIHNIALASGRRHLHVAQALEILLTLVNNTPLPLVDAAWINELLKRAAMGGVADGEFSLFLKLCARRPEAVGTGLGDFVLIQGFGADPQSLERTVALQAPTSDDILFSKIMKNIQTCVERDGGWQDETIYGGLIAIRDIRRLEPSLFGDSALLTLHNAMNDGNPLRVRQSAYDVILITQDLWLRSGGLRHKLEDLDFFRQLNRVVIEIARPDYQRSFLMMIEILSEDMYWHSYLRVAMDIWLPLRHEGTKHTLRIFSNVGELALPRSGVHSTPSFDEFLQKLVVDEWAAVPGRPAGDLTADRLKPLAEVTEGLNELLFDSSFRKYVLYEVEKVIPGLELRRESGYEGPGDDIRDFIGDLLAKIRLPPRHRLTFDG